MKDLTIFLQAPGHDKLFPMLKGGYSEACLKKIADYAGKVLVLDTGEGRTRGPFQVGDTIWFSRVKENRPFKDIVIGAIYTDDKQLLLHDEYEFSENDEQELWPTVLSIVEGRIKRWRSG